MNSNYHWKLNCKWDEIINANESLIDWTVGFCRIGDLCFDLVIRDYRLEADKPRLYLTYDLYVGGIDSGYGYGEDDYPYDYADGSGWGMESVKLYSFDQFKIMAEDEFTGFIKLSGYEDKANEPLHVW